MSLHESPIFVIKGRGSKRGSDLPEVLAAFYFNARCIEVKRFVESRNRLLVWQMVLLGESLSQ